MPILVRAVYQRYSNCITKRTQVLYVDYRYGRLWYGAGMVGCGMVGCGMVPVWCRYGRLWYGHPIEIQMQL